MPELHRNGSILFFCIGLVAVMVAVGFSLLQTVRLTAGASLSSQRQWLAQTAANDAVQHAMENIVADFALSSCASTYLDGQWHRPFYRLTAGDTNQPTTSTVPGADDDVRIENRVWNGIGNAPVNLVGYWLGWYDPFANGCIYGENGVARWYEPGYYEPGDPTTTWFNRSDAPIPSRDQPLFLDEALRRLVPATGETDKELRSRARYRLRYGMVVNDLCGGLLVNPALDVDYRDAWKPGTPAVAHPWIAGQVAAPTELGRRLERYRHSIYNMINGAYITGNQPNGAYHVEHAFMLRGQYMNVAKDDAGWPVAFPTMMRKRMQWTNPGLGPQSHRHTLASNEPDGQGLALFMNKQGATRLEGGQTIADNYCTWLWTVGATSYTAWNNRYEDRIYHNFIGPAFSFTSMRPLTNGYADEYAPLTSAGHFDANHSPVAVTPFGRPMQAAAVSNTWDWQNGPTDVPWVVNALTANPNTLSAMIIGYLPPNMKKMTYAVEQYFSFTGWNAKGEEQFTPAMATIILPAALRPVSTVVWSRDLFVDWSSPAFRLWPAPSGQPKLASKDLNSTAAVTTDDVTTYSDIPVADHPALYPNYWISDPRNPAQVYPGKYASLCPALVATSNEYTDDTGALIDADSKHRWGVDTHSPCTLVKSTAIGPEKRLRGGSGSGPNCHNTPVNTYFGWALSRTDDKNTGNGIETPMPTGAAAGVAGTWGYSSKDYILTSSDGSFKFQNSFWLDMAKAFTSALSVVRAHWVDKSTSWVNLTTAFPAGKAARSDMDSVADLDRVFLQQLGIDIAAPASSSITPSWNIWQISAPWKFEKDGLSLSNNIRSLVVGDALKVGAVTSSQRARAMELMLNDWRMSFLGSSAEYAPTFRPLDFDGDGHAICSAYAGTVTLEGDTWSGAAAAGGVGPVPDYYFSLTGNFTFAKSRFYRIIARGELWDNLLAKPASMVTVDTVVGIDPDGDINRGVTPTTGLHRDLSVLYQRWLWNRDNGGLPTSYP